MITAILFLLFTVAGYSLAIFKHPFWGILVYANIYFNAPDPKINWWANYLPDFRWSLLTAMVVAAAMFLHRDKLSTHKYRSIWWILFFYLNALLVTYFFAVHPPEAERLTSKLLTYLVTAFLILKSLANINHLRLFVLAIIGMAGTLSIRAYTEGKLVEGRLENIGPGDAFSSNEFGVLLAAILPLLLPFLLQGKRYEKAIAIVALIFMVNAFILCNSRGAFVAFLIGTFYVYIFVANKKLKKYLKWSTILVIPVFLYLADENFTTRISSLWTSDVGEDVTLDDLSTGRIAIWLHGLTMANDYPFGTGAGGFRELSRFYMPEESLTIHPGAEYGVRAAHNSYLEVLVEQGISGLLIYLVICFYTLYLLYDCTKKIKKQEMAGSFLDLLIVGLNISFAVSLLGGMFGSQVYYEFFWWQVAMSIVAYSVVDRMVLDENAQPIKQ